MAIGRKYDHPPLLAPGRHTMSLSDLERLILSDGPNTQKRRYGYQKIEEAVQKLLRTKLVCELWVDGSILTKKPDPDDVDLSIIIDHDVVGTLTIEQEEVWDQAAACTLVDGVDSSAYGRLPREHPYFGDESIDLAYNLGDLYGLEHSEQWLKGYVVLRLGENNVGLRICS